MRRTLFAVLIVLVASVGAIVGTRILASARPLDPHSFTAVLAHDMQLINDAWCWREICPGTTSAQTAVDRLATIKSHLACKPDSGYGNAGAAIYDAVKSVSVEFNVQTCTAPISQFLVSMWNGTGRRLGDMLVRYGTPSTVSVYVTGEGGWTFALTFRHRVIVYVTKIGPNIFSLLPSDSVNSVHLLSDNEWRDREQWIADNSLPIWKWRGFGINRYR